jgi:hypothetical protein
MGMQQAVRQGKWINRPKTGYDLIDGELVPNAKAPIVRRIFTLRAEGKSQSYIANETGINYSTVLTILGSRTYLVEVQMNGEWFPGRHEAIITPEQFAAAHRGRIKGRPKGTDLLSGRVRCGLCHRLMSIDRNGEGRRLYRCHHRGQGCAQPRRTNTGLLRAAVLGLRLIGDDEQLQTATICRGNVASCCACTTTTRSGPTCSPRRRPACPWPSEKRNGRPMSPRRRRCGTTTSIATSMTSPPCSPHSTSTAPGRPRPNSSDVSSSTSSWRRFRCYRITST